MKTQYKYIEFKEVPHRQKFKVKWRCFNSSRRVDEVSIGFVDYYHAWRQWVYNPFHATVYSQGCLSDIAHFIGQLNAQAQEKTKSKKRVPKTKD
jgi:hypothetical protein